MHIEHQGKSPTIDPTAWVAPNAVICGDVRIGAESRVSFGAVISAEGGPVEIGDHCIIMENAVIRGTGPYPARLGDHVLVGPHAHLSGCTVEDHVFVATGASIFTGARLGRETVVRINGVVHIKASVAAGTVVPIGWVAIGDPAEVLPPENDKRITELLLEAHFARTVFGIDSQDRAVVMPELTRRYSKALARHLDDRVLDS